MTAQDRQSQRQILLTAALPYANGEAHLGHMVEYLLPDFWARFQRMRGHTVSYVCATDDHGTPIMLRAQREGIEPEALIARAHVDWSGVFSDFRVSLDQFHSTHSDENRERTEDIYLRNREAGHTEKRTIKQLYDEQEGMFLPDRFIKGTCPKCDAEDQYGDACEVCGSTYSTSDIKSPVSVISGTVPVERETEHVFFKLSQFADWLRDWMDAARDRGGLHPSVRNKLDEWLKAGLQDWDITRDPPYFGFAIPGEDDKFFYVWLDAPIGYLASFKRLCAERADLNYDDYMDEASGTELIHSIGKDITYFHALFWPATLHGAGYRTPDAVWVHGFLTVNGQKMSKSRGTFIKARTYLDHLDPEYLRYYYACKLGPGVEDIDLNLEDFVARVNSDLVGKLVNIASRCAGFIARTGGRTADTLPEPELFADFVAAADRIADAYETREFGRAMREVMLLADRANQYIDERKPWLIAKAGGRDDEVRAICTQGLNLFKALMTYLKPVLPKLAEDAEAFLRVQPLDWDGVGEPLLGSEVAEFKPLMTRIDPKRVAAMVEASKQDLDATDAGAPTGTTASEPTDEDGTIDIKDFNKVDLRVVRIVEAEQVEGADKLLRLVLAKDEAGEDTCQVFAGIKASYDPATLVGRLTVMVANLAPRKMRFGLSEGMVLAASDEDGGPFLLAPDSGARPGMRVK
jgi:methionyl-tRNA synthetase